jgi:hypothetical protein
MYMNGSTSQAASRRVAQRKVGGDRGAGAADEHDGGDQRADFAHGRQHEEAAEAVHRAEHRQEVGGLEAGRAVGDRERRDEQRQPAEAQGEEELTDELAAVRVGRAQAGEDRLAREDHHVPEFLDQVPRGKDPPLDRASHHPYRLLAGDCPGVRSSEPYPIADFSEMDGC